MPRRRKSRQRRPRLSLYRKQLILLGTFGVIDLIRSGEIPAKVREDEIDRMRRQENRDGVIVLPLTRYQPGERVRVTRGPFATTSASCMSA
jgi:transcription antitermination factor NusG